MKKIALSLGCVIAVSGCAKTEKEVVIATLDGRIGFTETTEVHLFNTRFKGDFCNDMPDARNVWFGKGSTGSDFVSPQGSGCWIPIKNSQVQIRIKQNGEEKPFDNTVLQAEFTKTPAYKDDYFFVEPDVIDHWYVTNGRDSIGDSFCIETSYVDSEAAIDPTIDLKKYNAEADYKIKFEKFPDKTKVYYVTRYNQGDTIGLTYSSNLDRCKANLESSLKFIKNTNNIKSQK